MDIAKVIGTIVATQKDSSLIGVKICILQPLDEDLNEKGKPLIATDATSKRNTGEIVYYVGSGDAVPTGPDGRKMPVDAAVVGIVERINVKKEFIPG